MFFAQFLLVIFKMMTGCHFYPVVDKKIFYDFLAFDDKLGWT